MLDLILLASVAVKLPTSLPASPPVLPTPRAVPTPVAPATPKPSYVTPLPPASTESWSDKMWKRYKENSK